MQPDWTAIARRAWPNHVIRGSGQFVALTDRSAELFQTQLERKVLSRPGARWYRLQPPVTDQPWASGVWERD
jgi:hypothetical protein